MLVSAQAAEPFIKKSEIVYADECPEGYAPVSGKITLGVGESVIIYANAEKFAVSNTSIMTVDEFGAVLAVKSGTCIARTYFDEETYDDIEFEVKKAPASVKLSRTSGVMDLESTYLLTCTLSKDSAGEVIWSSSNPEIVSVDQTGLLTAKALGECVITVETYNGKTASCKVSVKMPAPAEVKLPSKGTMYVGETHQLTCTLEGGYHETVLWLSDNSDIVSVDEKTGLLTAVSEGECEISCIASGGNSAVCRVTVKPGSSSISLGDTILTIYQQGRIALVPEIEGGSGRYSLYSMNETVASVDSETNEIVGGMCGEAYIVAITPNFMLAECPVRVIDAPKTLTLSASESSFAVGESASLSLNLTGYELLPVTYTVSRDGIVLVGEDGSVVGLSPGEVIVTAQTGGRCASVPITVHPIASSLALVNDKNILGLGDSVTLKAVLTGGMGRVQYASGNPSVIRIDEKTGLASAVGVGDARVSASLVNGVSAEISVVVSPAPERFSLIDSACILGVRDGYPIRYLFNEGAHGSVSYRLSDPSLAYIENDMLYAASVTGVCTLYAQTHNGLTDEMTVTVKPAAAEILTDTEALTAHEAFDAYILLSVNETHPLNARAEGYSGLYFLFSSSHPEIASVSEAGEITARKAGTALIRISLLSGAEKRVLVCVE